MLPDLKKARLERGLSLEKISDEVNVSPRTLSKYETSPGKTPIHITVRLMRIYNIPLECIGNKKKPCL